MSLQAYMTRKPTYFVTVWVDNANNQVFGTILEGNNNYQVVHLVSDENKGYVLSVHPDWELGDNYLYLCHVCSWWGEGERFATWEEAMGFYLNNDNTDVGEW